MKVGWMVVVAVVVGWAGIGQAMVMANPDGGSDGGAPPTQPTCNPFTQDCKGVPGMAPATPGGTVQCDGGTMVCKINKTTGDLQCRCK